MSAPNAAISQGRRPPIALRRKLNPLWWFGNEDDGWWGDARFNPDGRHDLVTALRWFLRNPMHNLGFYVLGTCDRPACAVGKLSDDVFAPNGGWNWCWVFAGPFPRPFLSYRGKTWQWYLGWRPAQGALGLKFQRAK